MHCLTLFNVPCQPPRVTDKTDDEAAVYAHDDNIKIVGIYKKKGKTTSYL